MPTSHPFRRAAAVTTTAAVAALAAGLGAFGIATASASPAYPSPVSFNGDTRNIATYDGDVYVAERYGPIERMTPDGEHAPVVTVPDGALAGLATDPHGDLWFTVDRDPGIYEIRASELPTDGTTIQADSGFRTEHLMFTAPSEFTYALAVDSLGDVFASSPTSIVEYVGATPTTVLSDVDDTTAMTVAPNGDLWIATEDGAIRSLPAADLDPATYPRSSTDLVAHPAASTFGLAFVSPTQYYASNQGILTLQTVPAESTPTSTPSPTSTPTSTPTAPAVTAPVYPTRTSSGSPKVFPVTAGVPFSIDLTATGTPTPNYTIESVNGDDGSLPDGFTFKNGILTGTITDAYTSDFLVTASNSAGTAHEWIEFDVQAGAPAALQLEVGPKGPHGYPTSGWDVGPDGVDGFFFTDDSGFGSADDLSDDITATQGDTFVMTAYETDQWGNIVGLGSDLSSDPTVFPTVTSSVSTDTIATNADLEATDITFNHASPHTITATADGFTTSFTAQVSPLAVTTPVQTLPTPTAATAAVSGTHARHGKLAYTGSDPSTPLGWALALLVGGALVTVVRFRRRRTGR